MASGIRSLIHARPGTRGHDPGAIGATGLLEKHIAMSMAYSLKAALRQGGRYWVMITHDDEAFIPLDRRRPLPTKML
ncbi:N-acetylmuramoyl-L-alanine amidase [Bradyrhizobium murdochi]|uniref:N-acetylmuramoyl-L-alanine amidase n=1 Tax=Bradyrhizobium murdochi TaxID=1038859 RepID=UPI0018DD6D92